MDDLTVTLSYTNVNQPSSDNIEKWRRVSYSAPLLQTLDEHNALDKLH